MKKAQKIFRRGARKLIQHLKLTGTGEAKLDIARQVLNDVGSGGTEEDGAKEVVKHMRRNGVNETTLEKAQKFIDNDLIPPPGSIPPSGIVPVHVPPGSTLPQSEAVLRPPAPQAPSVTGPTADTPVRQETDEDDDPEDDSSDDSKDGSKDNSVDEDDSKDEEKPKPPKKAPKPRKPGATRK